MYAHPPPEDTKIVSASNSPFQRTPFPTTTTIARIHRHSPIRPIREKSSGAPQHVRPLPPHPPPTPQTLRPHRRHPRPPRLPPSSHTRTPRPLRILPRRRRPHPRDHHPPEPPSPAPTPPQKPPTATSSPASAWTGSPAAIPNWRPMNGVSRLTVHHSGDGKPFLATSTADTIRHLQLVRQAHLRRGMVDIAYHFAVDRAGRVWQLRSLLYEGQHVRPSANRKIFWNEHNIGIVTLGDFNLQSPTPAQLLPPHRLPPPRPHQIRPPPLPPLHPPGTRPNRLPRPPPRPLHQRRPHSRHRVVSRFRKPLPRLHLKSVSNSTFLPDSEGTSSPQAAPISHRSSL